MVEPALDKTHGINDAGAKGLTALIWFAGGPTFMTVGAIGGALAFSVLSCCFEGARSAVSSLSGNCGGFFRRNTQNSQATADNQTSQSTAPAFPQV